MWKGCFFEKTNPDVIDKARMLLELIFVRNGSLQVNLPCFESDVQFLICYLSTMWSIFILAFGVLRVQFYKLSQDVQSKPHIVSVSFCPPKKLSDQSQIISEPWHSGSSRRRSITVARYLLKNEDIMYLASRVFFSLLNNYAFEGAFSTFGFLSAVTDFARSCRSKHRDDI